MGEWQCGGYPLKQEVRSEDKAWIGRNGKRDTDRGSEEEMLRSQSQKRRKGSRCRKFGESTE